MIVKKEFKYIYSGPESPECDVCGIRSFSHIHKADTLPKDFETIMDSAPTWEKMYTQQDLDTAIEKANTEIVICAAIRMKDGYIVRGHRHCDAILTASKIPRYKEDSHAFGNNQGFVTSKNRYVDRIEGAKLQKEAGIKSKMPEGQEYLHGELYSEDLY